jgi:hypothetical protein
MWMTLNDLFDGRVPGLLQICVSANNPNFSVSLLSLDVSDFVHSLVPSKELIFAAFICCPLKDMSTMSISLGVKAVGA